MCPIINQNATLHRSILICFQLITIWHDTIPIIWAVIWNAWISDIRSTQRLIAVDLTAFGVLNTICWVHKIIEFLLAFVCWMSSARDTEMLIQLETANIGSFLFLIHYYIKWFSFLFDFSVFLFCILTCPNLICRFLSNIFDFIVFYLTTAIYQNLFHFSCLLNFLYLVVA